MRKLVKARQRAWETKPAGVWAGEGEEISRASKPREKPRCHRSGSHFQEVKGMKEGFDT